MTVLVASQQPYSLPYIPRCSWRACWRYWSWLETRRCI